MCTRIRFQKDPFWGVDTCRTSIRRPRSLRHGLILENVPPPETTASANVFYVDRDGLASSSNRLFCLFLLLASIVLLYCFTCLCPEEGVYVVCELWRQVIKETSFLSPVTLVFLLLFFFHMIFRFLAMYRTFFIYRRPPRSGLNTCWGILKKK